MITPLILGKGRSGHAIAKSLASLAVMQPELKLQSPVWLERGASLLTERKKFPHPILCIANPHGLHEKAILEAEQAQFDAILCEKPACVNSDQIQRLKLVKTPTAIFHVFRQTWGIQTLKQMLDENHFGELISIEGRYWQSSAAERALISKEHGSKTWKDDPKISGEFDTFIDIGTHWIDAVAFLYGSMPSKILGFKSYVNSDSPHRDSHVQLSMDFQNQGRAFGSISKTIHGATNHFEINLIGSKMTATWQALSPDEILIGEGRDRRILTRKKSDLGSMQAPFHGMGWIEGYIEIASRLLNEVYLKKKSSYPTLQNNLDVLSAMFETKWQ
jgi:predicted dehydrogenase